MLRRSAVLAICCAALAGAARAQDAADSTLGIEAHMQRLAEELSTACPLADPGDQDAFDRCRRHLFGDSLLRRSVSTILLWGRPDPRGEALKDTNLTQLAPEVWTGLYAPMFMYEGTSHVAYDEDERLFRAELGALFRNALDPGQYPYPFWHNARKWADYQKANTVVFWIAPQSGSIVVGQFTDDGREHPRLRSPPVARPPFDGQWMWTDARGMLQPQPALFQGLFSGDNPFLGELEKRYRALAYAMRSGYCSDCHVPDNPHHMRRLVLLQTPAHAAAEIKRLMKAVRDDDMPVDETEIYREIDARTKQALLRFGAAFEEVVDAAREWERGHPRP
jgi:hypothetical protein